MNRLTEFLYKSEISSGLQNSSLHNAGLCCWFSHQFAENKVIGDTKRNIICLTDNSKVKDGIQKWTLYCDNGEIGFISLKFLFLTSILSRDTVFFCKQISWNVLCVCVWIKIRSSQQIYYITHRKCNPNTCSFSLNEKIANICETKLRA